MGLLGGGKGFFTSGASGDVSTSLDESFGRLASGCCGFDFTSRNRFIRLHSFVSWSGFEADDASFRFLREILVEKRDTGSQPLDSRLIHFNVVSTCSWRASHGEPYRLEFPSTI